MRDKKIVSFNLAAGKCTEKLLTQHRNIMWVHGSITPGLGFVLHSEKSASVDKSSCPQLRDGQS